MDLMELFKQRYSCRKFSDKKVEPEKIEAVLEAARLAPTAVNFQPHRVFVLESDESLAKLRECTPYHFNAPVALLLCYDKTVSWKRNFDGVDYGMIDASIAGTQMMLEVVNQGLGTTWIGYFDPAVVSAKFELPENIVPVGFFPIGYPASDAAPSPKHFERHDLKEFVKYL